MSSESSPVKVTLGMIKGKPIAMSFPVIRYHASDDELEELYPSTDDEKVHSQESGKLSPKQISNSRRKSRISISDGSNGCEGRMERRSTSMDENLSESVSPSEPWKLLTNIKGKITKTFEDKISEMKNEKKKSKCDKSRDTSSVSDYEELGEHASSKDSSLKKKEKNTMSPHARKQSHSSRFVGFSRIKTGLKAKKSGHYSVESGVEAAESICESKNYQDSCLESDTSKINISNIKKVQNLSLPDILKPVNKVMADTDNLTIQIKNLIYSDLPILSVILCSCYLIPVPGYLSGVLAGILVSIMIHKIYRNISWLLENPAIPKPSSVPFVEVPAAKEHAVLEKFEGWLNELPYKYEPNNYHLARTKPIFLKLEGENLQIMETRTRIPKRAVWDESKHKPKLTKQRIYSLDEAKIELLPHGLIRRRRWSKKYPICITLERDLIKENNLLDNSSDEETQPLDSEKEKNVMEEEETDDDLSQSKDSKDIYEDCQDEDENEEFKLKLYLFARTDRQKEDWFRRLVAATVSSSKRSSVSFSSKDVFYGNSPSHTNNHDKKPSTPSFSSSEMASILSYEAYMTRYIDDQSVLVEESSPSSRISHDGLWINALLGRILFDMHKCPDFINIIQDKIQRKLSNIKLPYFMESLLVSELVVGQGAPVIHSATKPIIDNRGLWFDLDITYEGSLTMTIETKLNLMKLKRAGSMSGHSDILKDKPLPVRSPMFDSDVEDSPETSTEEDDSPPLTVTPSSRENTPTQSSGKKFLNMVDKLASNKYFQHATELSYVKRAMEGVSNTEIRLTVSVSSIEGCLAVNIPPPPSDRLWYGFKPVPKIILTAKPAVGERAFNIVYVTKWIETKLLREFEKIVVIPNMDDLMIPLCPNYPYST
ncbi:testis-expressed protein 2 [Phymastichus coffea]|uniref:testis-expressed protein 2 n=1 Tax=Phymastichus coffea TaxID=108790 RepID=UPI00273BFCD9|nr:testis-expressed protein 2 [Phymastichus coffea]